MVVKPARVLDEVVVEVAAAGAEPSLADPLDEVWMRKTIRRHVQEFALVFAIILFLIAGYGALKSWSLATQCSLITSGIGLAALGHYFPRSLHKVWRSWMTVGEYLGVVVTALILVAVWILMFIPFAIALRIIGKRVMNTAFREPISSYWEARAETVNDFKLLERQY